MKHLEFSSKLKTNLLKVPESITFSRSLKYKRFSLNIVLSMLLSMEFLCLGGPLGRGEPLTASV